MEVKDLEGGVEDGDDLDDIQKRRLRAVRRGYRAEAVEIKSNGWDLEITYMDGSKVLVSAKLIKLRAGELQPLQN